MFTEAQETKFHEKVLGDFHEALYNLDIEQCFDLKRLASLQDDKGRLAKIKAFNDEISALNKKKKTETKVGVENLNIAIEKVKYNKSKLILPEENLYRTISVRAEKIKAVMEMVSFVSTFKASKNPGLGTVLLYAVVNETKYSVVDNIIQKDDTGNPIIYIESAKVSKKK